MHGLPGPVRPSGPAIFSTASFLTVFARLRRWVKRPARTTHDPTRAQTTPSTFCKRHTPTFVQTNTRRPSDLPVCKETNKVGGVLFAQSIPLGSRDGTSGRRAGGLARRRVRKRAKAKGACLHRLSPLCPAFWERHGLPLGRGSPETKTGPGGPALL